MIVSGGASDVSDRDDPERDVRRDRSRRPGAVLQPRAVVAGVQRRACCELAEDPDTPLLERLKFCAICSSNLDEFFMVRVAGLHDQIDAGHRDAAAGRPHAERDDRADPRDGARAPRAPGGAAWTATCARRWPSTASGSSASTRSTAEEREALDERFRRQIFPVLTPLAVGLGRPFPYISNLSLSLGVLVRDPVSGVRDLRAREGARRRCCPRFVPVGDGRTFVPLEDLIAKNLDALFPGHGDRRPRRLPGHARRRLHGLRRGRRPVQAVEDELRRRRFGEVVRVEVGAAMSAAMREQITASLAAEEEDVFEVAGPARPQDLWDIVRVPGPRRPARRAVDAGHPAAAAARRGRGSPT